MEDDKKIHWLIFMIMIMIMIIYLFIYLQMPGNQL